MSGQSNMAFPVGKTDAKDLLPQANMPMLRLFSIQGNEQASLQDDIRPEAIDTVSGSWDVSSPETAKNFSAIGYVFGARRPTGAANPHRCDQERPWRCLHREHGAGPQIRRPSAGEALRRSCQKRMAEFDPEAVADQIWSNQKGRAKSKGQPEPPRPDPKALTSWNVPGKSPSDMGSVHNGYFGVFKGYNIKGVLFHQGFNNTLGDNCRPKRYRVLTKLMVEGWREDFEDPGLPVGIIGFCAGGRTQNEENFELDSHRTGPYIREAQRLGLEDVGDPENTEYISGDDIQVPGLHPGKKREHGRRAAQWALSHIYKAPNAYWRTPTIPKVEAKGDMMIVRFADKERPQPDDGNDILEGFSVAGEDGKFYMAHARYEPWDKRRSLDERLADDPRLEPDGREARRTPLRLGDQPDGQPEIGWGSGHSVSELPNGHLGPPGKRGSRRKPIGSRIQQRAEGGCPGAPRSTAPQGSGHGRLPTRDAHPPCGQGRQGLLHGKTLLRGHGLRQRRCSMP
jgi:sialate O-acetylesterase